jgi:hypothetical protein
MPGVRPPLTPRMHLANALAKDTPPTCKRAMYPQRFPGPIQDRGGPDHESLRPNGPFRCRKCLDQQLKGRYRHRVAS